MWKFQQMWQLLQTHVNALYDQDLDKLSADQYPGVRQVRAAAVSPCFLSAGGAVQPSKFGTVEPISAFHVPYRRGDFSAHSLVVRLDI